MHFTIITKRNIVCCMYVAYVRDTPPNLLRLNFLKIIGRHLDQDISFSSYYAGAPIETPAEVSFVRVNVRTDIRCVRRLPNLVLRR